MHYFLLLLSGKVISRNKAKAVTLIELDDPNVIKNNAKFDKDVSNHIDEVQGQQLTGD